MPPARSLLRFLDPWVLSLFFLVILVLLGGGTNGWTAGIALLVVGLFLIAKPPLRSPGLILDIAVLGLLVIVLVGFLPVSGYFSYPWWATAAQEKGIDLPVTLSWQPCYSLEGMVLMLGGCAWFYLVSGWSIDHDRRKKLLWGFAFAMALLATGMIFGTLGSLKYPFSQEVHNFSYFPNRNQTSNILALGGIVAFGVAVEAFRRQRAIGILGLLLVGVIFFALIFSLSRAGILLFVLGCFLCLAGIWRSSHLLRNISLASAGVVLVFCALVFFGGSTFERLADLVVADSSDISDFRLQVYGDTLDLIGEQPIRGTGLSNFPVIFPQYRDRSVNHHHIKHPESDWFWVCAELGLPGLLFLLLGTGFFLYALWSGNHRSNGGYRFICLICVLVFFLHSLVDVPGHRLGTFFIAAWLGGLALNSSDTRRALWLAPALWRVLGLVLVLFGCLWITAFLLDKPWHSEVIASQSSRVLNRASKVDVHWAEDAVNRAVNWAPLDWRAYFNRAGYSLRQKNDMAQALEDFRRVRFLEPVVSVVALQEGFAWLPYDSYLAAAAWREAMYRASEDPMRIIRPLVSVADTSDEVYERVAALSLDNADFRYHFLMHQRSHGFAEEFHRDLDADPLLKQFSGEQRKALLLRWFHRGGATDLVKHFEHYPALAVNNWLVYALALADIKRYSEACQLLEKHVAPPDMPDFRRGKSAAVLEEEFIASPSNLVAGTAWLSCQVENEDWQGMRRTTNIMSALPEVPQYVYYWQARVKFREGEYQSSFNIWRHYLEGAGLL